MDPKPCCSKPLSDEPSSIDDFGPHSKIAKGLTETILNGSAGGTTIGLEGSWGSGKSTVIRLAKTTFDAYPDILMVTFDAWAHRGDPLRRTFLESLICAIPKEWINSAEWEQKSTQLTQRIIITNEKHTPQIKTWGFILIICILLAAIGLALMQGGLLRGICLGIGLPIAWDFDIGLLLAISPIMLLLIHRLFGKEKTNKNMQPANGDLSQDVRNNPPEYSTPFQDEPAPLVVQQSTTVTTGRSTAMIEPTSIEFETLFEQLMKDSLKDPNRKMVLVVDNLDRIDSHEALSILSTLQTFLQYQDSQQDSWLKRIWVIIPYDRTSIKRLWLSRSDDRMAAESFLDKRFQIRFEVPPLIHSDWRGYLENQLAIAFPDHTKIEIHKTCRVYALYRKNPNLPPTPRELKLFVNQIYPLHQLWQDRFPLQQMGYFVLLKGEMGDIVSFLQTGILGDDQSDTLLGKDIFDHLAEMYFNADPEGARQLVLKETIEKALKEGNEDAITKLIQSNKAGFEPILENIPFSDWVADHAEYIALSAATLSNTGVFEKIGKSAADGIKECLRESILAIKNWGHFDKRIGQAVATLIALFDHDPMVMRRSLRAISTTPIACTGDESLTRTDIISWADGLLLILMEIKNSANEPDRLQTNQPFNFDEFIRGILIPFTSGGFIIVCGEFFKKDSNQAFWRLIYTKNHGGELISSLLENATTETYGAIRVMRACQVNVDWINLYSEIEIHIKCRETPINRICSFLSILWELTQTGEDLKQNLKKLVQNGSITRQLMRASSDLMLESMAWCLLTIASISPDLRQINNYSPEVYQTSDSINGWKNLKDYLGCPEANKQLTEIFLSALKITHQQRLPFQLLECSQDQKKWIDSVFGTAAKRSDYLEFFPEEESNKHQKYLSSILENCDYDKIFSGFIKNT